MVYWVKCNQWNERKYRLNALSTHFVCTIVIFVCYDPFFFFFSSKKQFNHELRTIEIGWTKTMPMMANHVMESKLNCAQIFELKATLIKRIEKLHAYHLSFIVEHIFMVGVRSLFFNELIEFNSMWNPWCNLRCNHSTSNVDFTLLLSTVCCWGWWHISASGIFIFAQIVFQLSYIYL